MKWDEYVSGKTFITDLGENGVCESGNNKFRYAIWKPEPGTTRHQIVRVGNELKQLQSSYNVPDEMVMRVSF